MLSCWIALADTRAEGGTVEYLLGSHRWVRSEAPSGAFHGPADYRAPMEGTARAEGIAPVLWSQDGHRSAGLGEYLSGA